MEVHNGALLVYIREAPFAHFVSVIKPRINLTSRYLCVLVFHLPMTVPTGTVVQLMKHSGAKSPAFAVNVVWISEFLVRD